MGKRKLLEVVQQEPEELSPPAETEVADDDDAEELPVRRAGHYTNKQRVLLIASRGITARYRHLLEDLKKLIPHHKKDNKLDTKGDVRVVNEIAELRSCNQVVYLECRKHLDLYLHISRTPQGPSVKFHVVNVHTMDELKLTGNAMLGSRPLLNFDENFETSPHFQLMICMLTDVFNTPNGHPKSKPFVDRVMSFYVVNNNICTSCKFCVFFHFSLLNNRGKKLPNNRWSRNFWFKRKKACRDRTSICAYSHSCI